MLSFSTYLQEEIEPVKHLKHLTHAEDNFLHSGETGFHHTVDALSAVNDKLNGAFNTTKVTTKYDGSPSIVFGRHPQTGKFFVASKSAFNVNPKINYSEADIDRNHGHAPGLVEKLKTALRHLPKVAPKHGVYQGDLMYTKGDVAKKGGKYHFTPNTITYSTPVDSEHGQKIAKAHVGLVVHTKYHGPDLANMTAGFDVDHDKFGSHPSVHLIHPGVKPVEHSEKNQKEFRTYLNSAIRHHQASHPEMYHVARAHKDHLDLYINHTVRENTTPTVEGYRSFVSNRYEGEIEKKKTPKGKLKQHELLNAFHNEVDRNGKHLAQAFKIHHAIQKAKNALVQTLSSSTEFEHHIDGKKTEPEGFVMVHNGHPTKLVNRAEFARSNLLKGRKK
jgi:hypothetical protein